MTNYNSRRVKIRTLFILSLVLLTFSCEKPEASDESSAIIYSNSFENSSDTIGWQGLDEYSIYDEAPVDGGSKSLIVGGGCTNPPAKYKIGPLEEECHVVLEFWSKTLMQGGAGAMWIENGSDYTDLYVQDTVWTHYISPDTLFCPADSNIILHFISGGYIPGLILIDLIEVSIVN